MNDPNLNKLFKWSLQNSDGARDDPSIQSDSTADRDPGRGLNSEAVASLFGGPSGADLMRQAMAAVISPEVDLENKFIAFDNFEQLIENLDNANNMQNLGLWMPLVDQLERPESEIRSLAAWCIGTAVQNNDRAQERCLAIGAIPKLVRMSLQDSSMATRKKAVLALSSEIRNYQPALNAALAELPEELGGHSKVDASDMDAVDALISKLRESIKAAT